MCGRMDMEDASMDAKTIILLRAAQATKLADQLEKNNFE
jgi:hypothetical protein